MVGDTYYFLHRTSANAYICWWDTLCFGELRPIYPETKGPFKEILYSVHPRDPVVTHEERNMTRERFVELASNVSWGLTEGTIDPLTGHPIGHEWLGVTLQDPFTDFVRCYLDIGKIEALMRADLTVSSGGSSCKD